MMSDFKALLEEAIVEFPEKPTLWLIEDIIRFESEPELLEDAIEWTGRWDEHHRAIYKHQGRYWKVNYAVGATEYQDSDSYGTEVTEVEPYEVTVTKYREKK
jgi:hypothetical protein